MDLNGTVAIVTGGGTGIGRAVSEALARAGAGAVVVNYSRSAKDAEETANELGRLGCDGHPYQANVAAEHEVRTMVAEVTKRFGQLDVLVNNAGTTHFIEHTDLDSLTDDIWNEILNVNLKGTFYCCRAAAPDLRKRRGAIVNVASIAGIRAGGSSIAYGVSKAAVLQLTRNLAVALAPEIRVNAIAPGRVATRWFRQQVGNERVTEQERMISDKTPLQAVATPENCAQVVVSLLQNDFVTGESLIIDGGKHLTY